MGLLIANELFVVKITIEPHSSVIYFGVRRKFKNGIKKLPFFVFIETKFYKQRSRTGRTTAFLARIHSRKHTHTLLLHWWCIESVGWRVLLAVIRVHAITDGFMHCYCLLGYCIVWRCKERKEQFDGRNSQVMTLKSTELKQRKHREVYIIQTKSHLHSFTCTHDDDGETKTIWKSSEKVTIMWSHEIYMALDFKLGEFCVCARREFNSADLGSIFFFDFWAAIVLFWTAYLFSLWKQPFR